MTKLEELKSKGRVYLAGGWFDFEQDYRLNYVHELLKSKGYSVFFPREEALVDNSSNQDWRQQVYEGNMKAIGSCSFMLCITDRKDMGTIWEAGVATGLNKPILYFAETLGEGKFNLMLAQSGRAVATSKDILSELLDSEVFAEAILGDKIIPDLIYGGNVE